MEKIFENFTVSILKLNKLVQKIKNYEMKEYGLKTIHVMCVYYLNCNEQGLTASELTRLTLEDKAAISRAIKLLQDAGYVACGDSKYNCNVCLTPKGKCLASAIAEKAERAVRAGSYDFTDEERGWFYKELAAIAENLEAYYQTLTKKK